MALKQVKDADSEENKTQELRTEIDVFAVNNSEEELNTQEQELVEEKKKGKSIESKKVEEEMIPLSQVEAMMAKMNSQFETKMRMMIDTKIGNNKVKEDNAYMEDLIDDWLENPAVFFAYSHEFIVSGDKNRGVSSVTPNGTIRFKPLIRTSKKTGKGTQVISVSSVKIHSQREVDYLRKHSQFGIRFFESMENAMTVDMTWAQKLVESNQSIQQLSDMQILDRAKQEGVDIISDIVKLRKNLVEHVARKNMAHEEKLRNRSLQNAVKDIETGRTYVEKTINA